MRALFFVLLGSATLVTAAAQAQTAALPNGNFVFGYPTFSPSQAQVEVTGSFKTLDQFIRGLQDATTTSSPLFDLLLHRIPATLGTDGPTVLALSIPSLGVNNQFFTGQTGDETFAQLKAFLTQGSFATELQRESARTSPFDPVAGNPTSLMARAVAFDFFNAFYPFASNNEEDSGMIAQTGAALPTGAARGPFRPLPGIGAYYGNYRDQGQTTQSLTIPLSLTLRSDLDPRRQFSLTLPITVQEVDGARVYQGMFGASLRLPLARDWAITPSLGYAQVRATELGTAGQIGAAALTSAYVFRTDYGDLALGNLVGYYRTLGGTIQGISTASGIANTVFRNGLLWSEKARWLASGITIEYSIVNTYYTGTALYDRNYTEIGVALGSNKRADSVRAYMQGGLTYLFSSKTKGVTANFGYWF
jgi:hypothetical protein